MRQEKYMANGKPHDHPLTNIIVHKIAVYGDEIDELIRKISCLSSQRELNEWWDKEIGWKPNIETILIRATKRYEELVIRSKENGWDVDQ